MWPRAKSRRRPPRRAAGDQHLDIVWVIMRKDTQDVRLTCPFYPLEVGGHQAPFICVKKRLIFIGTC